MKHYITRAGKPDFVCQAPTVADAIILFWMVEREIPAASYRVHQGKRRKARTVSSAVCFWRIHSDLRSPLYDVLRETSTEAAFTEFCEITVTIGLILGH